MICGICFFRATRASAISFCFASVMAFLYLKATTWTIFPLAGASAARAGKAAHIAKASITTQNVFMGAEPSERMTEGNSKIQLPGINRERTSAFGTGCRTPAVDAEFGFWSLEFGF